MNCSVKNSDSILRGIGIKKNSGLLKGKQLSFHGIEKKNVRYFSPKIDRYFKKWSCSSNGTIKNFRSFFRWWTLTFLQKKKTRIVSVSKRWLHHDLSVADRPLNHVPHLIASRVRMAAPRLDVTSTHRESGKDGKKTNVFRFYFCPLERSRISDVAWRTPVLAPFDAREPFRCRDREFAAKGPSPPDLWYRRLKALLSVSTSI